MVKFEGQTYEFPIEFNCMKLEFGNTKGGTYCTHLPVSDYNFRINNKDLNNKSKVEVSNNNNFFIFTITDDWGEKYVVEIEDIHVAIINKAIDFIIKEKLIAHTSEEWQVLYSDKLKVIDPDGWHRDERFHKEWYEDKITEIEWNDRVIKSTCKFF